MCVALEEQISRSQLVHWSSFAPLRSKRSEEGSIIADELLNDLRTSDWLVNIRLSEPVEE